MKDEGFEIIAAAQDTGGWDRAGKWYDKAEAEFSALVDTQHTVSTLFNMVNVPTGVWIDEEGMIVRPNEVAYSRDISLLGMNVEGLQYVAAIRDWVEKGAESEFVLSAEEVLNRTVPRAMDDGLADANFKLGVYFHDRGDEDRANKYWEEAQRLRPDDWNYHRQDWSFTPAEENKNWFAKFSALDGKAYYEPLDLGVAEEN